MKLIMLYGPPGAGKLTVGKKLEETTGFRLLHNHLIADLVCSVFKFRTLPAMELNRELRFLAYKTAAKHGIPGLISTFSYAADRESDDFLLDLLQNLKEHVVETYFIKLLPDTNTLENRVTCPSRTATKKIVDVNKLRTALRAENLTATIRSEIAPSLVIDNSHLSPDETAKMVREYCRVI